MTRLRLIGALALVAALLAPPPAGARPGPEAGAAGALPPVVMIVFDEFPTISLLDARGRVDAARYPSFARLARESTWFPNATASVDETGRAMEAILTGSTPERLRPATFDRNPQNLFTLLGRRYRMDVSEEVTSMCPRALCPNVRVQDRRSVLHELAFGRPERFLRWVRSIRPRPRPTLYFKHALFPHVPFHYLPDGRRYSDRPHEAIPGVLQAFHARWPVLQAYQRHLLQLGFTDRLLAAALRRLRAEGMYDRSLVVVTADNGESFGRFGDRHVITPRKAQDIALTPLFVKAPFQQRGRIARRHVRTVDVLPTLARLLGLRVPWRTEGRSALGPPARRIPSSVRLLERSGRRFMLPLSALRRRERAALARKLALFGSGERPPGLFGIGPDPLLRGTPVALWQVARGRGPRAELSDPGALRSVRTASGLVPALVTGRLRGVGAGRPRGLAIAVNGLIGATAPAFRMPGGRVQRFSALVPDGLFHDGANRVQVLGVSSAGGRLALHDLTGD